MRSCCFFLRPPLGAIALGLATACSSALRRRAASCRKSIQTVASHSGEILNVNNLIHYRRGRYRPNAGGWTNWNVPCGNPGELSSSIHSVARPRGTSRWAEAEYAHLIAFAREQATLLERIKRTGSQPPMQLEWRGAEAHLVKLRAAAEAAEQEWACSVIQLRGKRRSFLGRLLSGVRRSSRLRMAG